MAQRVREWAKWLCGFVSMELSTLNCHVGHNKHFYPLPAVGTWEKAGRSQGQRWDDEGQRADQGQNVKQGRTAQQSCSSEAQSL